MRENKAGGQGGAIRSGMREVVRLGAGREECRAAVSAESGYRE